MSNQDGRAMVSLSLGSNTCHGVLLVPEAERCCLTERCSLRDAHSASEAATLLLRQMGK